MRAGNRQNVRGPGGHEGLSDIRLQIAGFARHERKINPRKRGRQRPESPVTNPPTPSIHLRAQREHATSQHPQAEAVVTKGNIPEGVDPYPPQERLESSA